MSQILHTPNGQPVAWIEDSSTKFNLNTVLAEINPLLQPHNESSPNGYTIERVRTISPSPQTKTPKPQQFQKTIKRKSVTLKRSASTAAKKQEKEVVREKSKEIHYPVLKTKRPASVQRIATPKPEPSVKKSKREKEEEQARLKLERDNEFMRKKAKVDSLMLDSQRQAKKEIIAKQQREIEQSQQKKQRMEKLREYSDNIRKGNMRVKPSQFKQNFAWGIDQTKFKEVSETNKEDLRKMRKEKTACRQKVRSAGRTRIGLDLIPREHSQQSDIDSPYSQDLNSLFKDSTRLAKQEIIALRQQRQIDQYMRQQRLMNLKVYSEAVRQENMKSRFQEFMQPFPWGMNQQKFREAYEIQEEIEQIRLEKQMCRDQKSRGSSEFLQFVY